MTNLKEDLRKALESVSKPDVDKPKEDQIVSSMSRVLRKAKESDLGIKLWELLEEVDDDMSFGEIFDFYLNNMSEEQLKGTFALFNSDERTVGLLKDLFKKL